ncbi:MAG: PD-(D/E)XK nuclease family protein, partial [Phycisphaerae bacterium]
MAVRFVIGRAGNGKTYRCVEAIRAAVRENAVDGPRLILLVPEQAGLQMERSIIRPPDVVAAHRVEVLSFRRLAYRVLESVHTPSPAAAGAPKSPPTHAIEGIAPPTSADTPPRDANAPPASGVAPSPHVTDRSGGPIAAWRRRRALSEPARAMVLQHLVAARSSELRYYRRVDRFTGFFDRLAATIAELIQEGVVPDAVSEAADRGDGDTAGAAADPVQRAKLHDVGLIYRAYVDYLGDDRLDPSQYLQAARDGLAQCDWVDGAHLWVDGFASLMWQEVATLVALARRCAAVEITVLMDPGMVDVRGGASAAAHRLFAKTYRTYDDLRRALLDAGLDVAEPVLLAERRCPRFARSAALDRLERGLFEPGAARDGADAEAAADVSVVALPSRRVEAAYAASLIRRWVRDASTAHRYRDIALIVRDLEPYHDLMSSALRAAGIPFFIDRRRPTAHHPLVEWLRSVTAMASDGMSPTSVRGALKTDLFPITTDAADELENYVIARGVAGVDAWRGGDWSAASRRDYGGAADTPSAYESAALARINHARRVLIDAVGPWLEVATGGALTGAAWSGALVSLMQRLGVERRLEAWALEAAGAGDLDLAEEHRQVWRDTIAFLDDLAFALQDVRLGVGDFSRVLEAGLSRFTLGLAPPMLDQVLVGSIERSRHPEIKAAIIVGFYDGAFPRPATEDAILNDDDRALLERAGVRIGPPARRRTLDESLLLYVAATRACASLVFTYAAADNDGKQLRVSPYVDAVRAACPGLGVTRIDDPARTRDMWDILAPADAVRRLAMEFRGRGPLEDDDAPARGRWNELYDAIRPDAARTTAW